MTGVLHCTAGACIHIICVNNGQSPACWWCLILFCCFVACLQDMCVPRMPSWMAPSARRYRNQTGGWAGTFQGRVCIQLWTIQMWSYPVFSFPILSCFVIKYFILSCVLFFRITFHPIQSNIQSKSILYAVFKNGGMTFGGDSVWRLGESCPLRAWGPMPVPVHLPGWLPPIYAASFLHPPPPNGFVPTPCVWGVMSLADFSFLVPKVVQSKVQAQVRLSDPCRHPRNNFFVILQEKFFLFSQVKFYNIIRKRSGHYLTKKEFF